jgi:hypothetical protein
MFGRQQGNVTPRHSSLTVALPRHHRSFTSRVVGVSSIHQAFLNISNMQQELNRLGLGGESWAVLAELRG